MIALSSEIGVKIFYYERHPSYHTLYVIWYNDKIKKNYAMVWMNSLCWLADKRALEWLNTHIVQLKFNRSSKFIRHPTCNYSYTKEHLPSYLCSGKGGAFMSGGSSPPCCAFKLFNAQLLVDYPLRSASFKINSVTDWRCCSSILEASWTLWTSKAST